MTKRGWPRSEIENKFKDAANNFLKELRKLAREYSWETAKPVLDDARTHRKEHGVARGVSRKHEWAPSDVEAALKRLENAPGTNR
jgi:hypothetical protein